GCSGGKPAPEPPPALLPFRGRRAVVPSFTPYPTSTACRSILGAGLPSIPGSLAPSSGGDGTRSSAAWLPADGSLTSARATSSPAVAAPASADTSNEMIGVPTSTDWPSGTSSSVTTPSNGLGSSTSDFAVSISTMTWLTDTWSPGFTFQVTMSASVSPSPTSGSLNCFTSAIESPVLRTRTRG